MATYRAVKTDPSWEVTWYVRGGLDPRYASEASRDSMVKILARLAPPLAANFLRGWVTHHG